MIAIYAVQIDAFNPDNAKHRKRLSAAALEKIDRRHGQARTQSFVAMLLLEYAVGKHFPAVVHPLSISEREGGKPYLVSEPEVQFSLSHSGHYAVCAISNLPIGVDIEQHKENRSDIAARYFHKDEVRYLNSLTKQMRERQFYRLWTLKESYVKASGRGLDLSLRSFCIDVRRGQPVLSEGGEPSCSLIAVPFEKDEGYTLSVCVLGAHTQPPALYMLV